MDEKLKKFCTARQLEILEAVESEGSERAAAIKLGCSRKSIYNAKKSLSNKTNQSKQLSTVIEDITAKKRIASLEKQLLDEEYVKREIFKLAESSSIPPDWLTKSSEYESSTMGVPTLFCSDWHWGEQVFANQVNGINQYTTEIALSRAKELVSKTIFLLRKCFYKASYPGIVLAIGGDMVSGDIHEELSATNETEIMPVVVDMVATLAWCIKTLADEFERVFVPCVTGNHGRNTQKIRNKGRAFTSFDWLIYQMLRVQFKDDTRISFLIPDGPDAYYRIYNHRYLLSHGDQFRGGDGMIGALGPITRGDHKKRSRNGQIGMDYDTMLIGHFHQLMQLRRYIVNGSLVGYNEYAYNNNFGYEPPQQALWITHPEHGITFSMPVRVESNLIQENNNWVSVLS